MLSWVPHGVALPLMGVYLALDNCVSSDDVASHFSHRRSEKSHSEGQKCQFKAVFISNSVALEESSVLDSLNQRKSKESSECWWEFQPRMAPQGQNSSSITATDGVVYSESPLVFVQGTLYTCSIV